MAVHNASLSDIFLGILAAFSASNFVLESMDITLLSSMSLRRMPTYQSPVLSSVPVMNVTKDLPSEIGFCDGRSVFNALYSDPSYMILCLFDRASSFIFCFCR